MTVHELVRTNPLYTAHEREPVLEVVRRMVEANIGALPVLRDGELVGVFSERDLMRRVVAEQRDPGATPVGAVMSTDLRVVAPNESLENCMVLMKQHVVRHLPIVDRGRLVAMVSLRDILLHNVEEMDGEVKFMRAYIRTGT